MYTISRIAVSRPSYSWEGLALLWDESPESNTKILCGEDFQEEIRSLLEDYGVLAREWQAGQLFDQVACGYKKYLKLTWDGGEEVVWKETILTF